MPAATSSKRIKSTRVSRAFIIGSSAWNLDAATTSTTSTSPSSIPAGHTKGWRVYVRPLSPTSSDLTTWLKKVQFKLHHTYTDASRTIETPPFEISETGYGEFDIEMRLYFDAAAGEKAQYRVHRLRLEPFGTDEQIAKQKRENLVVAETCEIVEFNEPAAEFFAKMTGEEQFAHLVVRKGSGGAKGRGAKGRSGGKAVEYEGGREPSANLPERGTEASPWSRDMERKMCDMLAAAQRELDAAIEVERKRGEERKRRMAEVA